MLHNLLGTSMIAVFFVLILAGGAHACNPTASAECLNLEGESIGTAKIEQGPKAP